jgi:carbon storage regulator
MGLIKIIKELILLVLTRKIGEKIIINNNIVIEVLASTFKITRLGITAPTDVQIYREEIWNKINRTDLNK